MELQRRAEGGRNRSACARRWSLIARNDLCGPQTSVSVCQPRLGKWLMARFTSFPGRLGHPFLVNQALVDASKE